MIRAKQIAKQLAKKGAACVALIGLASAGWGCGLVQAHPGAPVFPDPAMAAAFDGAATADAPMHDCQRTDGDQSATVQLCVALCALTLTVAPDVSPPVAMEFGQTRYPAAPSMHDWLIQPEPYPPRA